jgi:hypothetical protein
MIVDHMIVRTGMYRVYLVRNMHSYYLQREFYGRCKSASSPVSRSVSSAGTGASLSLRPQTRSATRRRARSRAAWPGGGQLRAQPSTNDTLLPTACRSAL